MNNSISLHVLCRSGVPYPRGISKSSPGELESISWRFNETWNDSLIGKYFCIHDKKAENSYFGGIITRIERRPISDNNNEIRNVVYFKPELQAKGLRWPGNLQGQIEYCVNTEISVEQLKS